MKKILFCFSFFLLIGCKNDFLEKAPSSDINLDIIYSDIINAEKVLWTAYNGLPYGYPYHWEWDKAKAYTSMTSALTEDAESAYSWSGGTLYNEGSINSSTSREYLEDKYEAHWGYIRYSLEFIDNIDRVPNASVNHKKMLKAEAKLIVLINYYEMFIRYGGTQWLDKLIELGGDYTLPRLSVKDMLDKMIIQINEIIPDLPTTRSSSEQGRLNRIVAYFLKARLLLYASSPLYNTANPVVSFDNPDHNKLISLGEENPQLWAQTAEAARELITQAEASGYQLINTGNPQVDYRNAHKFINNNSELIFFTSRYADMGGRGETFVQFILYPWELGGNWSVMPTQNLVDKYQMRSNGLFKNEPGSGWNPDRPYEGLDPRFYETIVFNGSKWNNITVELWNNRTGTENVGVDVGLHRRNTSLSRTGYYMRKFLPEDRSLGAKTPIIWPYMRLAEAYLIYAEALNESVGPVAEVYENLNKIRLRAGMPQLVLGNHTKEQMREIILHERNIEFALEEHHYFDVRRWRKSNHGNAVYEVDLRKNISTNEYTYSYIKLENRFWQNHWHYTHFPQYEIDKNSGLIQNPRW